MSGCKEAAHQSSATCRIEPLFIQSTILKLFSCFTP